MSGIERGTPLYEQAYVALWDMILRGAIQPGQRIGDREWANHLQISRTPVREAMRQMERDGVLSSLEGGGYCVRAVDPQGLRDLYKCRASLEALAVQEAALRGDARLIKRLESVIAKGRTALDRQDATGVLKHNTALHRLFIDASKNEHLINLMASLERLILLHRVTLLKETTMEHRAKVAYFEHLERVQSYHVSIVEAFSSGEIDRAANLMHEHISATAADMDRLLAADGPA